MAEGSGMINLFRKLQSIQKGVDRLIKDGNNQFLHFDYVSAEQTIQVIRDLMNEHNVMVLPEITGRELTTMEKGRVMVELTFKFTILDTETGEYVDRLWYSQGLDPEMGPGKAITYGTKYFLWSLFLIPRTGDDPDENIGKEGDGGKLKVVKTEERVSAAELQRINSLAGKSNKNVKDILGHFKITRLSDLTRSQYDSALEMLSTK